MAPTVYQISYRRLLLLLVGSVALVAACVWALATSQGLRGEVAGVVGVPFFGLCTAAIGYRLVRCRPELVVDDQGIAHRTWGRVGWSEVQSVGVREVRVRTVTQRFIEVVLWDIEAHVRRAPLATRLLMRANLESGYSQFSISARVLGVPLTDVLAAMKRHHPDLRLVEGPAMPRPDGRWIS
jgi:hypothetical protein